MISRLLLAFGLLGTLTLSCASDSPAQERNDPVTEPRNVGGATVDPDRLAHVSVMQNTFALNLYRTLREHESGNMFFSPLSIHTALSMTSAGARTETMQQMADVLGLEDPLITREDGTIEPSDELHEAIGHLLRRLNELEHAERGDDDPAPPRLDIANALWGQEGYPFLDSFIAFLDQHYDAPLNEINFTDGAEAASIINAWVEQQTKSRIKDLLTPGVVQNAILVLTNAIYFKGDWQLQFDPDETQDGPFHVDRATTVTVPLMQQRNHFRYMENDLLQALQLDYAGDSLSMVVLLPRDGQSLDALEDELAAEDLAQWMQTMRHREVHVTLPRFTLEQEFSMNKVLQQMGMELPFTSGADFSGIDQSGQLFISDVIHKAFVEVNEEGTEAAAATGVVMPTSAMPDGPKVFRADRPFLFMIRDHERDSILFMGRMMQPDS